MKKTYVKPEVYFESFELSTSIATGCSAGYNHGNTTFGSPTNCAVKYGSETVFMTMEYCSLTDFDKNQFCYHVPLADTKVFSS